ncbi:hypothetical protein GGI19_005641, partial [Coemansia pectinata]
MNNDLHGVFGDLRATNDAEGGGIVEPLAQARLLEKRSTEARSGVRAAPYSRPRLLAEVPRQLGHIWRPTIRVNLTGGSYLYNPLHIILVNEHNRRVKEARAPTCPIAQQGFNVRNTGAPPTPPVIAEQAPLQTFPEELHWEYILTNALISQGKTISEID